MQIFRYIFSTYSFRLAGQDIVGIILGVLRLQVSVSNVYITNQFQTTFA
jgi:hypothetical protein